MIPILRTFTLIPITQVQLIESTMLLCNMSDRARFHMNLTQDAVNHFLDFFSVQLLLQIRIIQIRELSLVRSRISRMTKKRILITLI